MRVLLVAEPSELADGVAEGLRASGVEVSGRSGVTEAAAVLRRVRAERAVISADLDAGGLRRLISRLRHAAERPLPIALVLQRESTWLRARAPADLGPVAVLPSGATGAAIVAALKRLEIQPLHLGAAPDESEAQLDPWRRKVAGPRGTSTLTPLELALAWRLAEAAGDVVSFDDLAAALWGARDDPFHRAALRTHVHSLRPKLRAASADLEVVSVPRAGYRLDGRLQGPWSLG